jgi:hypothetical protein
LLAEKHNKYFNCPGFDFFPNTQHESCAKQLEVFINCRNKFDADIGEDSNYRIRGFFQNYGYYIHNMARLKQWLYKAPFAGFDGDDLLISVRLGDFRRFNVCLPFCYYESAIRQFNCKKFYIITDAPAHSFIKQFAKYKPIMLSGDPLVHFVYGLSFENVVMSNSTFCWWHTVLSSKLKKAVFPMPTHSDHGAYSLAKLFKEFLDLRIDDPRFTYIYNINTWGRLVPPVSTRAELGPCDYFHSTHVSRQQQISAFNYHRVSEVLILQ